MVTIKVLGSVEATIDGGTWTCSDEAVLRFLNTLPSPQSLGSSPDPDFTIAQMALNSLHGELVSRSLVQSPPDLVY